jgi:hypothetical protein
MQNGYWRYRLRTVAVMLICVAAGVFSDAAHAQSASISNPVFPPAPTSATTFKNGTVIAIDGTAAGAGFQNYVVEWAAGLDASSGWQTAGITIAGGGMAPVAAGPLASWDTSSVSGAGYFTIRLTVNASNTSAQAVTMVYLEPDLLSQAWPVFLPNGPYFSAGVLPAKNSDGTLRMVLGSPRTGAVAPNFWTLSLNGSLQQTFLQNGGGVQQPAVANMDGGSADQAAYPDTGNIDIFPESDAASTLNNTSNLNYDRTQIFIEDLNGDGQREVIGLGSDFQNQEAYVSAWRSDGTELSSNFPIQIPDQNPVTAWYNRVRVLAADVNADGKKELIVQEGLSATTFTLGLFASDGSPLNWKVPTITGIPEAMAAADFDHNGKPDIVLVYYSGAQAVVDVFEPDGSQRAGWPVSLPNPNQNSESFVAIGDLNRDGRDEIVYSHETYLYVLNDDGTVFAGSWPLQTSEPGYASVAIGDVDGDGYPEIVTTLDTVESSADPIFPYGGRYYDEKLLALHRDGSISRSWQLTGRNGYSLYVYPAPAIGDFDQDGVADIAVAYEVTGVGSTVPGVVTMINTGETFNPALDDWPLIHQNSRNSNVAVEPADFTLTVDTASPVAAGGSVTYSIVVAPNPTPYNAAVGGFQCQNLPAAAACSFSPGSVTPGANNASATLTISTTAGTSLLVAPESEMFTPLTCGILAGATVLALLCGWFPLRRPRLAAALCATTFFGAVCFSGCALTPWGRSQLGAGGTPAGSYQVTVSATGNEGVTHTTTLTLTVK